MSDSSRLFFGLSVVSPWEEFYPEARILREEDRHLTLCFLGNISKDCLPFLLDISPIKLTVGAVGVFDYLLFLPPESPHVVSYHAHFLTKSEKIKEYIICLEQTLIDQKILKGKEKREWLPHLTIGRSPKELEKWNGWFSKLPFYVDGFHLYESLGSSEYKKIRSFSLESPFIAIDHTADFGFRLRGESIKDLFLHAQIALSFLFPELTSFITTQCNATDLPSLIKALNNWVSFIDIKIGAPIKAISYHGSCKHENGFYDWEMIIDV